MLMRFDPFRELDRLFEQPQSPTPRPVAMDAVRRGDTLHVWFDLPGIDPDSVDLTVERNQLTLTAERSRRRHEDDEWLIAERAVGRYTRQLFLGDNLDTDSIEANYRDGVLEVTIPVREEAKPRKVSIAANGHSEAIEAGSTQS